MIYLIAFGIYFVENLIIYAIIFTFKSECHHLTFKKENKKFLYQHKRETSISDIRIVKYSIKSKG